MRHLLLITFLLIPPLAACKTDNAVSGGAKTTFLDSDDMVKMTDDMARSMSTDPQIIQAAQAGPLVIVIKPVSNQTNEIIRDNRKELFVARLQGLLASRTDLQNRFVWVINKADYDKLRTEEFPANKLGQSEDRVPPQYALWAEFYADTNITNSRRSDMYLCQYKLTNLVTGATLWTGKYETAKHQKKDFLD